MLDLFEQLVQVIGRQQLGPAHLPDALGNVHLRLVDLRQVDRLFSGDLLSDDLSPALQSIQRLLQPLLRHRQELSGGRYQLSRREEAVAIIQVVVQLKEQTGLPAQGSLPLHAQLQSQGVSLGEVHPKLPPG